MNIVVLIKEVPDMDRVKFDKEKGVVDRSPAETEINPFDMNALQTAVLILMQHPEHRHRLYRKSKTII